MTIGAMGPLDAVSSVEQERVAWVAGEPSEVEAADGLDDVDVAALEQGAGAAAIASSFAQRPTVVQLPPGCVRLGELRRALPQARLVLDLRRGGSALGRLAARDAAAADAILLGSLPEVREFRAHHPRLAGRTAVVPRTLDLEAHAPSAVLTKTRDRDLKRFKRLYRLVGPTVLYAGPYTEAGGLDLALEAVYALRERTPDLRLAAVPHGPVDARYLDRCERRALGLGHHGPVQWRVAAGDLPLWYATATVVCLPCRGPVPTTAVALAGAAARPFVGSRLEPLVSEVADGETGFLVAPNDVPTLAAAIELLLGDGEESTRLGAAGRERVESAYAPPAVVRRLRKLWGVVAGRSLVEVERDVVR
jgi:glycosyltransferase involved in cell wall biosynthesis